MFKLTWEENEKFTLQKKKERERKKKINFKWHYLCFLTASNRTGMIMFTHRLYKCQ